MLIRSAVNRRLAEYRLGSRTGAVERRRRGTATVEFTLLLPFLILMFVMAVDFGRVFYYSLALENCARAGAVYAADPIEAAQSPYPSYQAAALAETTNFPSNPSLSLTTGTDASSNNYVAVTATWQFQTITSYPGIPNTLSLTRTVQARSAPAAPN